MKMKMTMRTVTTGEYEDEDIGDFDDEDVGDHDST